MFRFARLQIEIEFLDQPVPADFLGSRLRGGYGFALLAQLCRRAEPLSCAGNPQLCECDYLRLFRPSRESLPIKPIGAPLGNQENLPAAFVIDPPKPRALSDQASERAYHANERVCFDFTAIGSMCDNLAPSIKAFEEFGKAGFILEQQCRGHFRVASVRDLLNYGRQLYDSGQLLPLSLSHPLESSQPLELTAANPSTGWQPVVPAVSRNINALVSETKDAANEIEISFCTPTRIENRNARSKDKETGLAVFSDFYDLIYNLANRVAGLWQLYGEHWPGPAEYYRWRELLLKQSREVTTVQNDLEMVRLRGYSNLQEAPKRLDGFVGRMQFAGDLSPFSQLLRIGEIVHVGTETTCGLGQYRLIELAG